MGAEGFIMGSLYTTFGLSVAGFTMLVPLVKDPRNRRGLAYGLLAVAFMAYRIITANHHWKTGLTTHWYF
jgi:hypothetical protein